ncbi:hypothetical protein LINGRAHAP2_LOCUS26583 [Linum grandiflorum]
MEAFRTDHKGAAREDARRILGHCSSLWRAERDMGCASRSCRGRNQSCTGHRGQRWCHRTERGLNHLLRRERREVRTSEVRVERAGQFGSSREVKKGAIDDIVNAADHIEVVLVVSYNLILEISIGKKTRQV